MGARVRHTKHGLGTVQAWHRCCTPLRTHCTTTNPLHYHVLTTPLLTHYTTTTYSLHYHYGLTTGLGTVQALMPDGRISVHFDAGTAHRYPPHACPTQPALCLATQPR